MDLKDFKLYGLCIERLKHQIRIAENSGRMHTKGKVELESYCTNEPDDIIDLLELYDIDDRTMESIMLKLSDLAEDASLFLEQPIEFGFNDAGELCLYLKKTPSEISGQTSATKYLAKATK